MAVRVLVDGFISVGGTDLSDHATSITLSYDADEVPTTAMGGTTHTATGGLLRWEVTVEFNNDEAASTVAQTLFPLVGTTSALIVRPDKSEGVGSTNPNYSGTGLLVSFPPLGGSVGELSKTTARWVSAGTLSRATS